MRNWKGCVCVFSKKDLNECITEFNNNKLHNVFCVYKTFSKKALCILNDNLRKIKDGCKGINNFLYSELLKTTKTISVVWKKSVCRILYLAGRLSSRIFPIINKYRNKTLFILGQIKKEYNKGFSKAILEILCMVNKCFRNNKSIRLKLLKLSVPFAAITIMFCTINYWNNLDYGLAVAYEGEEIATIQDEGTLEKASQIVNQRLVCGDNNDSGFGNVPTYKLVVNDSKYDSSLDVSNRLIEQSKDIIEEATSLYIDDTLIGVVKDGKEIENLLKDILNKNITENGQDVAFVQNVEQIDGLYSKKSIISLKELKKILDTPIEGEEFYTVNEGDTPLTISEAFGISVEELESLNPGDIYDFMHAGTKIKVKTQKPILSVAVTIIEKYEKEIDFQTIEINDDNEYQEYSKVTQEGEKGIESCIDKVSYVDGKEVSREQQSREVTKNPVDKNVIVGTRKRVESTPDYAEGSGNSVGNLIWPVPYTKNITSEFGPRWGRMHTGIDIAANGIYGKNIIAADGGIVTATGCSSGYGNYVEISHGNGIKTLYAHASEIYVSVGMKVSQGQPVAAVGSSGNSTGPHCHFEVIVNGSNVNPENYV